VELLGRAARSFNRSLRRRGIEVRRVSVEAPTPPPDAAFRANAKAIRRRHNAQTRDDVESLRERYAEPVFGHVSVWELVERQAQCIDPSDLSLLCGSQEVHVLQMLDALERDGITDRDLLVAALIHDLGKLLLLTGEDPANVVCSNEAIGEYDDGCGLDQCVFQWNHDEFAYSRFKDHVPDHVAWLLRYHSIKPHRCLHLMDERDLAYNEKYFTVFTRYDQGTKSAYDLPLHGLADDRDLIEETFPSPILF